MARPKSTAAALATLAEQIHGDRGEREAFRVTLDQRLGRIEANGEKTNGRVTRLELWRAYLLGGFAALSLPAAAKIAQLLQS
jgi:hypothetical protein